MDQPHPKRWGFLFLGLAIPLLLIACEDKWEWIKTESSAPPCTATWWVSADIPYAGGLGGAEPYRSPAGHSQFAYNVCVVTSDPTGAIDKPVIVVDGLDALNQKHWDHSWNRANTAAEHDKKPLFDMLNKENLFTDAYNEGIDFIIVDPDGGDYIQRNAFLLIEVIGRINAEKISDQPIVVVGPSMGGIISRYALAYMEAHGMAHDVALFISFDAPHRGANVALGNQLWIEFLATHPTGNQEALTGAKDGKKTLDSVATRQLLIYHYTDYPDWQSQPERQQLVEELDQLGYPRQSRNVSIVNGSGYGTARTLTESDEQLLNWHNEYGTNEFDCKSWAIASSDAKQGHKLLACREEIRNKWKPAPNCPWYKPWCEPKPAVYWDSVLLDPLDSAPGSYIDTSGLIADPKLARAAGDIEAYVDGETHIPTWSALDIDPAAVGPLGIAALDDPREASPFDALYYPDHNQEHVLVTLENKAWILAEIRSVFYGRNTWHVWQTGDGWSAFESLGSPPEGLAAVSSRVTGRQPLAAAANSDGRSELFAIGARGTLWHRWQRTEGGWSQWSKLSDPAGGLAPVSLEVAANSDGSLEAFAFGNDGGLWHIWQTADGWSHWDGLGAPAGGLDPTSLAVAANDDGRLEVFALSRAGDLWHIWQDADGWSGWDNLGSPAGGLASETLAAAANANGRLEAFALGNDGAVWHIWQSSDGWSGWDSLGAPPDVGLGSTLVVGTNADGRLEVFGFGGDGDMWHRWQRTDGWADWHALGYPGVAGSFGSSLAIGRNADGRLEMFTVSAYGNLWHMWQRSDGWSPWHRLGFPDGGLDPGAVLVASTNIDDRLEVFAISPFGSLPYHSSGAVSVALFDSSTAEWHLRAPDGSVDRFFFGLPGDYPILGDWDGDGIETAGIYRSGSNLVALTNANRTGAPYREFAVRGPGDVALAGDFNGDGFDTVSMYDVDNGRVFISDHLAADGGIWGSDFDFYFGVPGDKPFVGDFNADGKDTIGLHRESSGFMYYTDFHVTSEAVGEFYFGIPGDRVVASDWSGDLVDTVAVYRPPEGKFYFRFSNSLGFADDTLTWGEEDWMPLAGRIGVG